MAADKKPSIQQDLNPIPPDNEACALPLCYNRGPSPDEAAKLCLHPLMSEKLFFTKRQIWVRPTETGSEPVCSSTPRQRMSQSYRLRSSRHDLQQTGYSGRCDSINIFGDPWKKKEIKT